MGYLRDLRTGLFPCLEREFDFSTRSTLILITGFCTPDEIRVCERRGPDHLPDRARSWRKAIPSMVDAALAPAAAKNFVHPALHVAASQGWLAADQANAALAKISARPSLQSKRWPCRAERPGLPSARMAGAGP
jgi:hypothetical protein